MTSHASDPHSPARTRAIQRCVCHASQIRLVLKKRPDRDVCLYPELKVSTWHNSLGFNQRFEDIVLDLLGRFDLSERSSNVYIQSFETTDLQYVASKSTVKLIQLLDSPDDVQFDTNRTYAQMMTQGGLDAIAEYGYAISPDLTDLVPVNSTGYIDLPGIQHGQNLVVFAHSAGLKVHPWDLKNENRFLPWTYGQDPYNEYDVFVKELGVDGFFTDFPATAKNYLNHFT